MTTTIEDVAGWLREAGREEEVRRLRSGESIHDARTEGERWYLRAAQVEAMGWRPIEECPKDATFVDLWNSSLNARVTDCLWIRGEWKKWDETDQEYLAVEDGATHFMFVPQPPVKR